ncbi:MAG: PEP-CTERM sorting domain-containing protein [Planctomycetes bacterium]|nr:PEP-CTERM sorting domain-containing protein [Planctomycetota bacterium]
MKSRFFPGGRNCKLLLIFSLIVFVSVQASALIITEDFENVTTASTTFTTDGVINHSIIEYPGLSLSWDVSTSNSSGPAFDNNALDLWAAQDIISFTLADGHYIDYASIDYMDWGSGTWAQIVGDSGNVISLPPAFGVWRTLEASSDDIGPIHTINLASTEGAFDNLTVNIVVPEPITLSLLGLGSIILRRRKGK